MAALKVAKGWLRWEDVTFDLYAQRRHVRRELARELLWKSGQWSTWAFLYQERSKDDQGWNQPRIALVRLCFQGHRYAFTDVIALPRRRSEAQIALGALAAMATKMEDGWAERSTTLQDEPATS